MSNAVYEVIFNPYTGKWDTFISKEYGSQNIVNIDHENGSYWFRTIANSPPEAFDKAYKAITEKVNSDPHKKAISDARDRAWIIAKHVADVLNLTNGEGDGFNTPTKESYWLGVAQGLNMALGIFNGTDCLSSSLKEVANPIPYARSSK